MRQTEHILYITLIDFLLQILFLGMVVGVIYAATKDPKVEDPKAQQAKSAQETLLNIKKLTGVSNITELTDLLTRLGPLQQANKKVVDFDNISSDVDKVGGLNSAKKILADHAAISGGQGSKSCLPNKAKLATLHVFRDRIELGSYDPKEFPDLLEKLSLSKQKVERLSLDEFTKSFGQVKTLFPDCKFNVDVVEHSFDTRPRDVIRPIFWAATYKKAPGIQ